MTRIHISGPDTEPITLAQAKLHARVEHDADDALITGFIVAAREDAEHELGRLLAAQVWQVTFDAFPAVEIALGPDVTGIQSIQYLDTSGVLQTLDPAAYVLDNMDRAQCFALPADGYEWPTTYDSANAVRVRIACGLDPVPETVRAWMLLRVGTLIEHRAAVAAGQTLTAMPDRFVDRLLDRYRIYSA